MVKVTKQFSWDMAHLLEDHEGKCASVHGHLYKCLITVEMKDKSKYTLEHINPSSKGMVVDFKELKNVVNEIIVDFFDHSFAYNLNDKNSCEIANFLQKKINQKLAPLPFRTTAENMASWIYDELNEFFIANNFKIKCSKIILYETPTSFATVGE